MKKPSWVRQSGPFVCSSLSNGYILVQPSWPQYGAVWRSEEGGGPGAVGRIGLAADLQKWLNSVYTEAEVGEAKRRVALHGKELKKADRQFFLTAMGVVGNKEPVTSRLISTP